MCTTPVVGWIMEMILRRTCEDRAGFQPQMWTWPLGLWELSISRTLQDLVVLLLRDLSACWRKGDHGLWLRLIFLLMSIYIPRALGTPRRRQLCLPAIYLLRTPEKCNERPSIKEFPKYPSCFCFDGLSRNFIITKQKKKKRKKRKTAIT